MEVKHIIPNLNRPVMYKGSEYTLIGSAIRKDINGRIYYLAELLDKNKNSVCIATIEEVDVCD